MTTDQEASTMGFPVPDGSGPESVPIDVVPGLRLYESNPLLGVCFDHNVSKWVMFNPETGVALELLLTDAQQITLREAITVGITAWAADYGRLGVEKRLGALATSRAGWDESATEVAAEEEASDDGD